MTISTQKHRSDAIEARRRELLTVKEFAFLINRHPQTIYRRIYRNRQPGVVRDGTEIFIDVVLALRENESSSQTRRRSSASSRVDPA